MKIKILVDNNVQPESGLVAEHGLSLYLEHEGCCALVDTGATGAFLANARVLGLDLAAVDFCLISHGHDDHTGGLREFLELDSNAKVILSSEVFTHQYFSNSRGEMIPIGTDPELLDQYLERFNCLEEIPRSSRGMTRSWSRGMTRSRSRGMTRSRSRGMTRSRSRGMTDSRSEQGMREDESHRGLTDNTSSRDLIAGSHAWWLSEGVAVVACGCERYPRPGGNGTLYKSSLECPAAGILPDDFTHELSLAVKSPDGVVVISSCSHCGAANIIESALEATGESRLRAFVGGLHFTDRSETLQGDVADFLHYLDQNHPEAQIYTGHCTGDRAKALLAEHPNLFFFQTGMEITI